VKEQQAVSAASALRDAGWDVLAQPSRIARLGWELVGKAADRGKPVFGFSYSDMALLIETGQVARL
jgi:hypothetical protein